MAEVQTTRSLWRLLVTPSIVLAKSRPVNSKLSHPRPERVWVDAKQGRSSTTSLDSSAGSAQGLFDVFRHRQVERQDGGVFHFPGYAPRVDRSERCWAQRGGQTEPFAVTQNCSALNYGGQFADIARP